MSSSFLATDFTNSHDCYLELLELDQVPSSAYGGRPNVFAVMYLERSLSAPHTVRKAVFGDAMTQQSAFTTTDGSAPLTRTVADASALSYAKFTVGSTNAVAYHPSAGINALPAAQVMLPSALDFGDGSSAAFASAAQTGVGGALRVARSNIITNASITANFESKFCVSNCHDREVIRITVYDQLESSRGFLGTAIFPVGGPLRNYGSRTLQLEGPTNMSLRVSWEMSKSSSTQGQQLSSAFNSAMGASYAAGTSAIVSATKQRLENEWAARYNNHIQTVSALAAAPPLPTPNGAAPAANSEAATLRVKFADETSGDAAVEDGGIAATPPTMANNSDDGHPNSISAREAHLELKVRELEAALLNVAKNRDEMVQRELLRRVAVGEAAPTVPSNYQRAADAVTVPGGSIAAAQNLMALSVKDLTLVSSQGVGTLSHALAQSAAQQQLSTMGADGLASSTIAALKEARERGRREEASYYNKDLMSIPSPRQGEASSPTSGGGAPISPRGRNIQQQQQMSMMSPSAGSLLGGENTCPNLVDLINHPCRTLSAEEDAMLKAYLGPRALYQSDKTAYAASTNSALFGSTINFPSLAPHHGHALEASYILGTDAITCGMQKGLPPLLGSTSCPTSMPLSYARNNLKFKASPMINQLSTTGYVGGIGSAGSLGSSANQSPSTPISPAKRHLLPIQQPNLNGLVASNTVLNDIAIASMYPSSGSIALNDPLYQDNTAAWKRALAHRETYSSIEGSKIVAPGS